MSTASLSFGSVCKPKASSFIADMSPSVSHRKSINAFRSSKIPASEVIAAITADSNKVVSTPMSTISAPISKSAQMLRNLKAMGSINAKKSGTEINGIVVANKGNSKNVAASTNHTTGLSRNSTVGMNSPTCSSANDEECFAKFSQTKNGNTTKTERVSQLSSVSNTKKHKRRHRSQNKVLIPTFFSNITNSSFSTLLNSSTFGDFASFSIGSNEINTTFDKENGVLNQQVPVFTSFSATTGSDDGVIIDDYSLTSTTKMLNTTTMKVPDGSNLAMLNRSRVSYLNSPEMEAMINNNGTEYLNGILRTIDEEENNIEYAKAISVSIENSALQLQITNSKDWSIWRKVDKNDTGDQVLAGIAKILNETDFGLISQYNEVSIEDIHPYACRAKVENNKYIYEFRAIVGDEDITVVFVRNKGQLEKFKDSNAYEWFFSRKIDNYIKEDEEESILF